MRVDLDALVKRFSQHASKGRMIIAIAGAPGSGKSTFAERLKSALNDFEPHCADVVPMDGFHFDDNLLLDKGWREQKGAPHTFDVGGLHSLLQRLRKNDEAGIAVPVFDREIETSRNGARIIEKSVRVVLCEGNYLLLKESPWADLLPFFDDTIFLETSLGTIRQRLMERWQNLPHDEALVKIEHNDLPNARRVMDGSVQANITLTS